jgi:ATP-dependent helicase/nuclease subunit A
VLPDMKNPVYITQQKGTATHKIFELLPFGSINCAADVEAFIHQCVEKEQIPEFWEALIPSEKIFEFCRSELGQRMTRAETAGRLYRERPFVMGIPVGEVYPELAKAAPETAANERILIQGVIDVYFEEDDGIVLMDYKTDRIPYGANGDELLIRRYKTQLDYYQKAIEQISGKKVKERLIYSVVMNREIRC